jgi:hypothetical protein
MQKDRSSDDRERGATKLILLSFVDQYLSVFCTGSELLRKTGNGVQSQPTKALLHRKSLGFSKALES